MRWGRVKVSQGFLLLCAWLFYLDHSGLIFQTLLSCTLHELGHLIVLRWLQIPVNEISITAIGAQIKIGRGVSCGEELAAAAAGPLVNLSLAYAACPIPSLQMFAGTNLALAAFNLLPVGDLDGGRILRSLLYLLCPEWLAQLLSNAAERVCSLFFLLCGLVAAAASGNVTLCLVSLWILCRPLFKKRDTFLKKE